MGPPAGRLGFRRKITMDAAWEPSPPARLLTHDGAGGGSGWGSGGGEMLTCLAKLM